MPTESPQNPPYVGRLAPSPTGAMHLGIAQTSLAAWLDARAHQGRLLLRIEDVDKGRKVAGADQQIMRDLQWLGIDWDGEVVWQSQRDEIYQGALGKLSAQDRIYRCTCSRKEIARAASAPHGPSDEGPRYPEICRPAFRPKEGKIPAYRLKTHAQDSFKTVDRRMGQLEQNVHQSVGDFVLKRADALWAYQLAVTVDDLQQGVTCIIRGADLLGSTPRQILLRQLLAPEAPPIDSFHTPLLMGADGKRLAKRDGSFSLQEARDQGTTAEELIGRFALNLDLRPDASPVKAQELIKAWRERWTKN